MLRPPAVSQSNSNPTYCLLQKSWANLHGTSFLVRSRPPLNQKQKRVNYNVRRNGANYRARSDIRAVSVSADPDTKSVRVKATATIQVTVGGFLSDLSLTRGLDDIKDLLGQTFLMELASAELDPSKYYCFLSRKRHTNTHAHYSAIYRSKRYIYNINSCESDSFTHFLWILSGDIYIRFVDLSQKTMNFWS